MRPLPTALALGLALVGLTASADAAAAEKKDIIMIVWDATRPDHLSAYGYERDTTPNLKALTSGATRFDDAQASGSWTIPSVASMFTGLFSHNHMVDFAPDKELVQIPMEATTLAETLGAQGYYTALFTAQSVYYHDGYTQGFERHEMVGSGAFKDRVVEVMEAAGDKPVFMVLYWLNPHSPYDPPAKHDIFSDPNGPQVDIVVKEADKKDPGDYAHGEVNSGAVELTDAQWAQLEAKYDGELRSNDQRTQNCLERYERFRKLDDAVFVFTSDHGEMFNERPQQRTWHGWPTHENQRVPLIVKAPGQTKGSVVQSQVRGVDIFPTVLELAGAELPHKINGESLVPLMNGGPQKDRTNVGATHLWKGMQYYTNGSYNLITARQDPDTVFLYDLAKDPEETTDIAASNPALVAKLKAEMAAFIDKTRIDIGVKESGMSSEEEERLRMLGYIE